MDIKLKQHIFHNQTLIVLFVILLSGCNTFNNKNDKSNISTPILKGRKAVDEMISLTGESQILSLMDGILKQPSFSGTLREWGCIAIFDKDGELIAAQTLKVKDYNTQRLYPIRSYTETELSEVKEQIYSYQKTLSNDHSIAFPIFSESMRLAVAHCAINEKSDIQFYLKRGDGQTSEQLQVIMRKGNSIDIIAIDALYSSSLK